MAKKLIYNYEFDASAKTIKVGGNYTVRKLILITNTTDGVIIYNFAEPSAGATVYYDTVTDKTTITLEYDTTSMSDGDELQILADDAGDTKIDAGESLVDPVHKFRVSNPQNLIDTDFEYGLQPTKWETIELVDNIPSVYTAQSGVSIGAISEISTTATTDTVTVKTGIDHDLGIGDPIEVQGTSSRTVNGKYVVTAVPNNREFIFRAGGIQSTSKNVQTAYATIIPGSFFSGSDITYRPEEGIATNNAANSTLSLTTNYDHGINANTSVYIRNTVGKKEFTIATVGAQAPDGSNYVDISTSSLYIPNHNLFTGQELIIDFSGSGAAAPSTPPALVAPGGSTTIDAVYQGCKTWIEGNLIPALEGISMDGSFYLYNPYSSQSGYYVNSYNAVQLGGMSWYQGINYFQGYGPSYLYFYTWNGYYGRSAYAAQYRYLGSNSGYGPTTMNTGNPINLDGVFTRYQTNPNQAQSEAAAGGTKGWWGTTLANTNGGGTTTNNGIVWYQASPFQNYTLIKYVLEVWQIDVRGVGANYGYATTSFPQDYQTSMYWHDQTVRNKWGARTYYYRYNALQMQATSWTGINSDGGDNNETTSNRINLGNGWEYTWATTMYHRRFTNWFGYYGLTIWLENTGWPGMQIDRPKGSGGTADGNLPTAWARYTRSSVPSLIAYRYNARETCGWKICLMVPFRHSSSIPYPIQWDTRDGGTANVNPASAAVTNSSSVTTAIKIGYDLVTSILPNLSAATFDNTSGTNSVNAVVVDSDRIQLKKGANGLVYDFQDAGTGPFVLSTAQIAGVVDNYYAVTSVGSTTINIQTDGRILPRTLNFTEADFYYDAELEEDYFKITGSHGCQNGQKLTFTKLSGDDIPGVTSGNEYYAIVDDNLYLRLASTYDEAVSGQSVITGAPASASTYKLDVFSINGVVSAPGLVSAASEDSLSLTGEGTRFSSTYKIGDNFSLVSYGATVNSYVTRKIVSIVGDTGITLDSPVGFAVTALAHYVDTTVNVRADGSFLHRPFDGGVEITAGKSPDSTIVRQTRKYFRYQSGKGIQCSMAINFNPARPARLATGNGTGVTLTTEYPHGLTAGDTVLVSGAEEIQQYTPTGASYDPTTGLFTVTINNHGFNVDEEVYFEEAAFTLQCAKDAYATDHPYPRSTDPAGKRTRLRIKSVPTNSTFVVDVGTSTNTSAHTVTQFASNGVKHIDITNAYNGTHEITAATDFTFSYVSSTNVSQSPASGYIDYVISGYKNAGIRAGLFDFQNGFFFEYDGKDLSCVRRSSVQQLGGTALVQNSSNIILGENTKFTTQLQVEDLIVARGQTYKVAAIKNDTEIHVQPSYRGTQSNGVVLTKTVDTKARQKDWNIDKADGTGPSGYILDINKIQMAYMDYSWYGAGKIRFGFKDTYGHVKYMHEFIHNNKLNEAYMRSGNVPARYEVFNTGLPTYVPSLFHWGTSVIMDGGFDDDDSYLFTASGQTLTFTNGDADTADTNAGSVVTSTRVSWRLRNYYLRLSFPTADAGKFSTGIALYTDDGELNGQTVAYTGFGSGVLYVYIFLNQGYSAPGSYPNVQSGTTVNIGAETVGITGVDLTSNIPLISVRLAPSADNNLIGELGERDIVNRMQLKLQELGISVSHDANISVILNGSLSNLAYDNVGTPSLSQYISHSPGDTVQDGTTIYQFRASGGAEDSNGRRLVASNAFDLSTLTDLGNSILGGDGVFPNGPDIITIAASVINTSQIDKTSSFQVASRISWAESQA